MYFNTKYHPAIVYVFILVFYFSLCAISEATDSDKDAVIRGTLILALANENGFVLMTDSRQTETSADGTQRILEAPGKKLFQLDSRSACMIAGFASTNGLPTIPQFYIDSAGIIEKYQDELAKKPGSHSISEKLSSLSFLFRSYIGGTATLRRLMLQPEDLNTYIFQLIIGGYDADGSPKLEMFLLLPEQSKGTSISFNESITTYSLGKKLTYAVGGIPTKARDILQNPAKYTSDPIIHKYKKSIDRDGGNSFSLQEMKQLAENIMRYTEKDDKHVGGSRQIISFEKGKPPVIEQFAFPHSDSPIPPFSIISGNMFGRGGFNTQGNTGLYISNRFDQDMRMIDGNFFFMNFFSNSLIKYDGGITHFDRNNEVHYSTLVIGKHVVPESDFLKELKNDFKWRNIIYEAE